jgi:hypothetical protein
MTVKEVDRITSVLKMNQGGQPYTDTLSTAREHIADSTTVIIFVPRDRRAQEICFGSVLPRKFAAWLMRHPDTNMDGNVEADMVTALTSIFASDRCGLDDILDDQGIIQVAFDDEEDDEDEESDGEESNDEENSDHGHEEHAVDSTHETDDVPSELNLTPTHSFETGRSSPHTTFGFEPQPGLVENTVETIAQQSNISHQTRPGSVLRSTRRDSSSSPRAQVSDICRSSKTSSRQLEGQISPLEGPSIYKTCETPCLVGTRTHTKALTDWMC